MSFEPLETSRAKGTPTETYLFRWGEQPGSYFAYTSHGEPITLDDGITYTPVVIKRDTGLQTSGTLDKAQLKLRMQRDISIRSLFVVWPPSSEVSLTLRQGHFDDPDSEFLVCFAGKVMSFEREDSEAIMTCNPISMDMKTPNLRRFYQYGCPLLLYGSDCRANRAARTNTVVVTTVNTGNSVLTLPAGWDSPYGYAKFRRGEARWLDSYGETQVRQIIQTTATTIKLGGVILDLANGDNIDLSAGCNHLTTAAHPDGDCVTLHENGPNYGGDPWIPLKNPVGFVNGFY